MTIETTAARVAEGIATAATPVNVQNVELVGSAVTVVTVGTVEIAIVIAMGATVIADDHGFL